MLAGRIQCCRICRLSVCRWRTQRLAELRKAPRAASLSWIDCLAAADKGPDIPSCSIIIHQLSLESTERREAESTEDGTQRTVQQIIGWYKKLPQAHRITRLLSVASGTNHRFVLVYKQDLFQILQIWSTSEVSTFLVYSLAPTGGPNPGSILSERLESIA